MRSNARGWRAAWLMISAIAGCAHNRLQDDHHGEHPLHAGITEDECRGAAVPRPLEAFAVVLRAPDREAASRAPSEADQRAFTHYKEMFNLGNTDPSALLPVLLTLGPSRASAHVAFLVAQSQAELGLDIEAIANADLAASLATQALANPKLAAAAAEIAATSRLKIAHVRFDLRHMRGPTAWLDGAPLTDDAALSFDAGHHRVSTFVAGSGQCIQRELDLGPGDQIDVRIADEIEVLVAR